MQTLHGELASGTTAPSPEITVYPAVGQSTGIGLIIFPGGGYSGLAEHEGAGYATYFSNAGIACFVVRYRLGSAGNRHPAMLEDALAAVATVREQSHVFGVDPDKVGVMGSSAGGHLAAHCLTAWGGYEAGVSLRPSFGVLCYPVILSTGPWAHKGSMQNLAGAEASAEQLASLSCESLVSDATPPCFLWHTVEDAAVPVENSVQFAAALRQHQIPYEMHVYPYGRHGLGLDTPYDWGRECLRWLKDDCFQECGGTSKQKAPASNIVG